VTGFVPLFARQKTPMIVFDSDTRDLGKVWEGDELKQTFKFTNKGDGQLEILNVQPG
jgi:hypothetical protein